MDSEPPFRIQIRKVDRDEFTVYRWGEIEGGEIVKTYEPGVERFGPLEEFVEWSKGLFPEDADPEDPRCWLEEWHDFGSQAQTPRADVVHPYLDRHLWGLRGIHSLGVLEGMVAPSSYVESVDTLNLGKAGRQIDYTPFVTQYRIGELPDESDLAKANQIAKFVHPTVKNIITSTVAGYQGRYGDRLPDFDRFVIIAMLGNTPHCRVEFELDEALQMSWENYDLDALPQDSCVYYNAGSGEIGE